MTQPQCQLNYCNPFLSYKVSYLPFPAKLNVNFFQKYNDINIIVVNLRVRTRNQNISLLFLTSFPISNEYSKQKKVHYVNSCQWACDQFFR